MGSDPIVKISEVCSTTLARIPSCRPLQPVNESSSFNHLPPSFHPYVTTHVAICVAPLECHGNSPHRVKSNRRQILYVTSPPAVQGANLASCGVEGAELIDTVVIDTAVISFPSSRRLQMYFSSTIISSHTAWSRYRHFHRNRYGGAADRVAVAMSLLSSLRLVQPLSAAVHD